MRTGTLRLDGSGRTGKSDAVRQRDVFGLGAFASIGLPGFANFAAEVMVFFGAFRNGADMSGFHIYQVATLLALWGVVISAVYMLRAYRATFLGSMKERWSGLPELQTHLRDAPRPSPRRAALVRFLSANAWCDS